MRAQSFFFAALVCFPSRSFALPIDETSPEIGSSKQPHTALLRPWSNELNPPSVQVTINGIPRWFVVDTGSADLIVYTDNTTCTVEGKEKPEAACAFGDVYTGPFDPIKDMVYNQTFGTGQIVAGQFGNAKVEIAGITVETQKVAFATRSSTNPFPGTSGILGLAPQEVEAAFEATDPAKASLKNQVFYPTVFESMYNITKQVDPIFTLALESDPEGGYLTFGGFPPINFNHSFVTAPFKGLDIGNSTKPNDYYPLQPDGFEINGAKHNTSYRLILDSGTYVSRLPEEVAEKFNGAFNPPAKFDSSLSLHLTSCNATIPKFDLTIAGRTFHPTNQNLLKAIPTRSDICATGITRGFNFNEEDFPDGFYVAGDLFLSDLVVAFDVSKKVIMIAQK